MRDYEVVYIFDSALPENRIQEKLDRFHGALTGNGGAAEVTAVDLWGKRQLTYPIRKKTAGFYVVAQFRAEPEALPEFERLLKLDEELLRYLLVVSEGEPTAPVSPARREPRREDEEGDEPGEEE
ncbi:MAG: 30S ribosomal protein S6 [Gemmatimonadetes bacterium]|nr:30S ribosomal protein S6 [Gemmatimonadota bacterium]